MRVDYSKSIEKISKIYDSSSTSLKIKYDTSTRNIIDALAKYGLKYDTAQQRIEKLVKDSANRKTTIILRDNPIVRLCLDSGLVLKKATSDSLHYQFRICGRSASAILKEATIYSLLSRFEDAEGINNLEFGHSAKILGNNIGLPKDEFLGQDQYIVGNRVQNFKTIFIVIIGTYTDSYGKNPKPLNEVGMLIINSKKYGSLAYPYDEQVRDFLRKRGIKI